MGVTYRIRICVDEWKGGGWEQIQSNPVTMGDADEMRTMVNVLHEATPKEPTCPHVTLGSWDCPKSPHGTCEYESDIDPCHDRCVHCGEPEERK